MFDLRPATPEDTELLWFIQCETLSEYITAEFGTDVEEQRAFFDEHFQVLSHQVILIDGREAGHLFYETRGDHVHLANIALLPEFQRHGKGTAIVRMVINEAARLQLPVRLQVMTTNPTAIRWYERLGFTATGVSDNHVQMKRD